MFLKLFSLFSFSLILLSCASTEPETLTIATFNIQWLGDGIEDKIQRTDKDYQDIAEFILKTNADILALQEIENEEAMNKILKYLPEWKGILNDDGYLLNLAYIYKSSVNIENKGLYTPIKVLPNRTRSGQIAKASFGNFDFYLMNLHFKATSRYDDTDEKRNQSFYLRRKQSEALSKWVDSMLVFDEKDIIILGDFNDNPIRSWSDNLISIKNNKNLEFITSDLGSCKNPNWDNIDHFLVSKSAKKRVVAKSVGMISQFSMFKESRAEQISDHCPVVCTFEVKSPDND